MPLLPASRHPGAFSRSSGQIETGQRLDTVEPAIAREQHQLSSLVREALDEAGAEPERAASVLGRERSPVERAG